MKFSADLWSCISFLFDFYCLEFIYVKPAVFPSNDVVKL